MAAGKRGRRRFQELLVPPRSRVPGRRAGEDSLANDAVQAIWDVVAMIPAGEVRSYGEVAREAQLPGRARLVGYALRIMPPGLNLPWHRVLGAGGRIVFPVNSRQYREQGRRLRSEGLAVKDGRVRPATAR